MFLDCGDCFADYLREETPFVDFVRDRSQPTSTSSSLTLKPAAAAASTSWLYGRRTAGGNNLSLKAITGLGIPRNSAAAGVDDISDRPAPVLAADGAPPQLQVNVELAPTEPEDVAPRRDPWNSWVFSVRGSASANGEESNREREASGSFSADRITPNWKLTLGMEFDHETEEFNLDEEDDEPVEVSRRERELNWLVVKALGEHWSVGATGEIRSSTFDNTGCGWAQRRRSSTTSSVLGYQRRQLRAQYSLGLVRQSVP